MERQYQNKLSTTILKPQHLQSDVTWISLWLHIHNIQEVFLYCLLLRQQNILGHDSSLGTQHMPGETV